MPNNDYANEPNQSRSEEIIQSILDNTEYDEAARSRIEYLLIELKNAIEGGGGGGGVTSYSPLTEKPKIDNHTLQAGNNSSSDLGLQTKLTFDSTPTENSTNPVTSGGVYTALGTKANSSDVYNKSAVDTALGAKADKSTTYTKTEVDTALGSKQNTISDLSTIRSGAALGATAVQPADMTSALAAKQDLLSSAQLAAVNSGITSADVAQITINKNNILSIYGTNVKNLWNVTLAELKQYNTSGTWSGNVYTIPDTEVTATFNSDGTITINGTPAINKTFNLGQVSPKFKGCIFSACPPTGGSRTTYVANVNYVGYDEGNGLLLNNDVQRLAQIELKANYAFNNLVFSPMICTQTAWNFSRSYQPYAPSNTELYAMIQALQAQLNQ